MSALTLDQQTADTRFRRFWWIVELGCLIGFVVLIVVGAQIGGFNGAYVASAFFLAAFGWAVDVRGKRNA